MAAVESACKLLVDEDNSSAAAVYDVWIWKELMPCLQVFTGELFRCIRDIDRTAAEIASDSPGTSLPDSGQIRYVCRPRMAIAFPPPVKPRRVPAWTGVYGQRDDIGLEQARVGLCGSCLHTPMSDSSTMSQDTNTDEQPSLTAKGPSKTACTICRAAKMKCVGADIKNGKSCDRCTKQGSDCIFEQHRRGRKPGSVLSDSSKELRRLEKHRPSSNKGKSRVLRDRNTPWGANSAVVLESYAGPPSNRASERPYDDQSDDEDENGPFITPAVLIKKESKRQTSLEIVHDPQASRWPPSESVMDPVSAGIVDDATAKALFDWFFLRINPFICLFDPALHSVDYIRLRSPFLFTVLLMVSCKFFKPEVFHRCQELARELATQALTGDWKSVEVVQAFACLCYWEEPEDTRSWTYIGHACRMAIEIGLNRYKARPATDENELQQRERRNRERTYLVLVVHDRSLAMHTGLPWMLPEDEIVRNGNRWHEHNIDESLRPNDILVSAVVELRWGINTDGPQSARDLRTVDNIKPFQSSDEELLVSMNSWADAMKRATAERLHIALLRYMWLYVRVLNSSRFFGRAPSQATPETAVSTSYESALESLRIVYCEFASMNVLMYGQDSLTGKNAYCATILIRILRRPDLRVLLHDNAANEIYQAISLAADAYESAATSSPACTSLARHAQFLRNLAAQDIFKAPQPTTSALVYTSVQSPSREMPGQWSATQPTTPSYESTMYAPPWSMRTLSQTQLYPAAAPQVNATAYNSQHQIYAASAPSTSVGAQPYWERVPQGVAGQDGTGFGVYAQADQDYWHAG
ncbi:hypothetical protein PENSPDRAFT_748106 [Peniophora sp. CONT]|nr:hypothetical protein PENSPDRAFT_748106 [Peniophora sp. CONT]